MSVAQRERGFALELGTSRLVGNDADRIRAAFADAVEGRWHRGRARAPVGE